MPLTLREVLELAELREAAPDVLVGADLLDRPVRWVHSSEIYEIGPLLFGDELLLTTGLGLAGADAGARRHYVREIAGRGVAGVALELGRTFPDVPAEMVDEARHARLPLVALRAVVPFIRITEAANTTIVDDASRRLRHTDVVTSALNEALIAGAGVAGLLDTAGAAIRAPMVLVAAGGALVAAFGVDDDRSAWTVVNDGGDRQAPVTLHGREWGRLVVGPGSPLPAADLAATLERTAVALALAVLRTGSPPSERDRLAAALLADLVDGAPGRADVTVRAGLAGFHPPPGHRLVGVAVDAPETAPATAMIDRVARRLGGSALRGRVLLSVLGLVTVPPAAGDPVAAVEGAVRTVTDRSGAPQVTLALGHPVDTDAGPGALAGTLRDARAALALAIAAPGGRPGSRPLIVTSRGLALELELLRGNDRAHLEDLVRRTIGPVADWDAGRSASLVHTLETYLRHGCSPTRTAAALHLGRQTLYQRLQRIESLLGHGVDGPDEHAALLVATCAARVLRTTPPR